MNIFVKRLQSLLEEKDIKQKELAQKVGVSEVTISRYLNGDRTPRMDVVVKISKELGVTTDYLLGENDIKYQEESEGVKLAKQQDFEFENPEDALKFILGQPAMMDYGGYNLDEMPEEEILEIANDILLTLRISIERRKNKNR